MKALRAQCREGMASKIKGYASGGRIVPEDIADKSRIPKVSGGPGRADGGSVDGKKASRRMDRAAKTTVNVVIAPSKEKETVDDLAIGRGAPPVPPVPPMPMPPPAPPMMRKRGGRVMHDDAAQDKTMIKSAVHKHESNMHKGKQPTKLKTGGAVDMDAGAGGGLGRLEKVKDYGKKAGKPAKGT